MNSMVEAPLDMWTVRLSLLPMMNELRRRYRDHWAYAKRLRSVAQEIKYGADRPWPRKPLKFAYVHIERHSRGSPDVDNLISQGKMVMDVLQPFSRRHPMGLGVIMEDDPDHVHVECRHCKCFDDSFCVLTVSTQPILWGKP